MGEVKDWRPFVYGGLASITAEFGKLMERQWFVICDLRGLSLPRIWCKQTLVSFVWFIFDAGTFPIDTTKTRLQIQGQKIDQTFTQLRYRGMTDAFVKISREEGLRALYSG